MPFVQFSRIVQVILPEARFTRRRRVKMIFPSVIVSQVTGRQFTITYELCIPALSDPAKKYNLLTKNTTLNIDK